MHECLLYTQPQQTQKAPNKPSCQPTLRAISMCLTMVESKYVYMAGSPDHQYVFLYSVHQLDQTEESKMTPSSC